MHIIIIVIIIISTIVFVKYNDIGSMHGGSSYH